MSKLVHSETIHVKHGRFEAKITREFYDGEEERKAQVKALRYLKSLCVKKEEPKGEE